MNLNRFILLFIVSAIIIYLGSIKLRGICSMFKKLKFKIEGIVILIFTTCIIVLSVVSFFTLRSIIFDNFTNLTSKSFSQSIDNVSTYMKLIEESSKLVSQNENIVNILGSPNYDTSTSKILNIAKNTQSGILGIALLDCDGNEYSSENVSSYPSLDSLDRNKDIKSFLLSNKTSFWLVRNNYIAGTYSHIPYEEKLGIISFITKIIDSSGKVEGYLCIDLDPDYVYGLFLNNNEYFTSGSRVYISSNHSGILPHKSEDEIDIKLTQVLNTHNEFWNKNINVSKYKFMILSNSIFENNKVILAVSLSPLYKELNLMAIILIIINLILITISAFIGTSLSNSITVPLTSLYKKMNQN